jgi:hypothetical protein
VPLAKVLLLKLIVIELMAVSERYNPTILITEPLPFLSSVEVIKDVLKVEPAYENISTVKKSGIVVELPSKFKR